MKPVSFNYVQASSLEEAVTALQEADGAGKVIAGGQSLVPLLNMRLARPTLLVDINRLNLGHIRIESGNVVVGATVRQNALERNPELRVSVPLLAKCVPFIGHPQTRNRGTVVGSIVHADPSAELPLVATVLDAEVEVFGPSGTRTVSIHDMYFGYMTTSLAPDDIAVAVRFHPSESKAAGYGFAEVSRRHGDFAIAAAACELALTENEEIAGLRLALGGVHPIPLRLFDLEQQVLGQKISVDLIRELAYLACRDLEPDGDLNASGEYRKHLARVLTERVLRSAWQESLERGGKSR